MIRAAVVALSITSCAKQAPPPGTIPADTAAKAAAGLRLGAMAAGQVGTLADALEAAGVSVAPLRGPEACVAGIAASALLLTAADGVAQAATKPVIPAGAVDVSGCGVAPGEASEAIATIVQHGADITRLSLDIAGLQESDPCSYTYAMAALDVLDDIVADGIASGGLVFAWDEIPLTGVDCAPL